MRSLHHVSFTVDDLDRGLAFYQGLLGAERIPRPELDVDGVWLRVGGTEVHLIVGAVDHGAADLDAAVGNHVAFAVADLDGVLTRMGEAGYVSRRGSILPQAFVVDPFGNLIEFIQPQRIPVDPA
jgi:catechol 2,3-dioxygenase-like lactoylglutathione lyase family enzyme